MNNPRIATVTSTTDCRTIVTTEDGEHIDVTNQFSPRYPVGTTGVVEYIKGQGFGLYHFVPDQETHIDMPKKQE